ncbi:MAG TPA: hypothetical protein VHP58_07205 [Alphaproteobacteria bacterium]|nr:hypothetical protein [Alphaproteobacteria bacterium]
MKAQHRQIAAAAAVLMAVALPFAAHASGYLSNYSGGGNYLSGYSSGYGRVLNAYTSGGYSGGYGGYTVVNYGYNGGYSSPDTPHRSTWAQYNRAAAQYTARAYANPPCGAYDRQPLGCRQTTTRWNPLINQ